MPGNLKQHQATDSPPVSTAGLSAEQDKAIAVLLVGQTVTRAAQAAGVRRETIWKWFNGDPDFIAAFNSYRAEMRAAVRAELVHLSASAVKAMRDVLESAETPAAVKVKAAESVLKLVAGLEDGPTDREAAEVVLSHRMLTRRLPKGAASSTLP